MMWLRTLAHIGRIAGQATHLAVAGRRPMLLLVLFLAPLILVVALIAGAASPFVVYPFL